jgi:hypothetical protein
MTKTILIVCLLLMIVPLAGFAQRSTVFPQFSAGGGWSSEVILTNQGLVEMLGISVNFFGQSGAPLSVSCNLGTGTSFTFDLEAGSTQAIRFASAGTQLTGYIVVNYPLFAPVRATEVFRYEQGGSVLVEVGVPQQLPNTNFSFPVVLKSADQIFTVLSLANAPLAGGAQAQSVILSLIRSDGSLQKSVVVALDAGQHKSLYLNEASLFGDVGDFTGSLSVSSTYDLGILAMRQDKQAFGAISTDEGPILAPFAVSGNIALETEPNNYASQAQVISGNTLISGTIGSTEDMDSFKFAGKKGDIVSVVCDTQGLSSSLDSLVFIAGADLSIVAWNDQNGLYAQDDSFLQIVLPADGTYYVVVLDYYGWGGSDYPYKLHMRLPGAALQ